MPPLVSGQNQVDRITAVGDPDDLQSQEGELTCKHLLQIAIIFGQQHARRRLSQRFRACRCWKPRIEDHAS